MKNHNINRKHIFNIVRVLVIFIGMFLGSTGCKNPLTPEEVVNKFSGNWILTKSVHQEDSVYIGKALLVLNRDSTFTCNVSFFMRRDSLISRPISGTWRYNETNIIQDVVSSGRMMNEISFQSGKIISAWACSGSVTLGYIELIYARDIDINTEFRWEIVKD
jgi:hypothetical protein